MTLDGSVLAFVGISALLTVLAKSRCRRLRHAVPGLIWFPLYAYTIDRLSLLVRGARRWLERLSGAALIGLGLRLAVERR